MSKELVVIARTVSEALIPGSRLVVLENAGHAPFDEQKDAFLAAFREFMRCC